MIVVRIIILEARRDCQKWCVWALIKFMFQEHFERESEIILQPPPALIVLLHSAQYGSNYKSVGLGNRITTRTSWGEEPKDPADM